MGIKSQQFNFGIYGENTYLLIDEGSGYAAIVDPGCISDKICDLIDGTKGLQYILLTHGHGDHIACMERYLEKYPDAKVVAHFDEQDLLTDADLNNSVGMTGTPISRDADLYVTDGETIEFGETTITCIATPGHTKGGVCYLMDGKLYSGDTLFQRSVGRTDLYGGNWPALKASIQEKLFHLPEETVVYSGHGGATTIGTEKRVNPFV